MSLREHLDQLNSILLDLCNIDIEIDDEDTALILLVSLPLSYENFRESFISGKDVLSLEEVRSTLYNRELRHSCNGTVSDGQVVGLVENNNQGYGKSRKNKFSKKPVSIGLNSIDICNYCKQKGHWKNECPKKRQMQLHKASSILSLLLRMLHIPKRVSP